MLQDLIEELIGTEIVDETDQFVDNLRSEKVGSKTFSPILHDGHMQVEALLVLYTFACFRLNAVPHSLQDLRVLAEVISLMDD